jgi:hypothetical protein
MSRKTHATGRFYHHCRSFRHRTTSQETRVFGGRFGHLHLQAISGAIQWQGPLSAAVRANGLRMEPTIKRSAILPWAGILLPFSPDRSEIGPCQPRQFREPFKGRDRSPQRSVRMDCEWNRPSIAWQSCHGQTFSCHSRGPLGERSSCHRFVPEHPPSLSQHPITLRSAIQGLIF